MNPNKTPSKKVLARREKIKNVAFDLFLTKGFQETSLSDIIKLSGGSYLIFMIVLIVKKVYFLKF